MVTKRDGFGTQPPRVKSRWRDRSRCYMLLSPEGSVEDYLRWCRDNFSPSKYRTHLAKTVEASAIFNEMLSSVPIHSQCSCCARPNEGCRSTLDGRSVTPPL